MKHGRILIGILLLLVTIISPALAAPPKQDAPDIVDLAVADGRFTTLVAAVTAAELVDTLKGEGPFTVFAPTDDAFAALPEGTVEALLADIPALTDILLYHVVSGKVLAADVVDLSTATTVQGQPINISVSDGVVKINDAQVIITDIEASNGVIHVIDAVITPPEDTAPAALPVTGGSGTSLFSNLWFIGALIMLIGLTLNERIFRAATAKEDQ